MISTDQHLEFQLAGRWKEVYIVCRDKQYFRTKKEWEQLQTELDRLYSKTIDVRLPDKFPGRLTRDNLAGRELCMHPAIKPIVKQLILDFIVSEGVTIAFNRFGMSPEEGLKKLGGRRLALWFVLRTVQQFPALSRLFFNSKVRKEYTALLDIPFDQLAQYLPCFVLYRLWEVVSDPQQLACTRWLARGNNFRKFPGLPFPITKRMAHWLVQAPINSTFASALLYAEVRAYGGSTRVFEILRDRYSYSREERPHWEAVIPFLVRNEALLDPDNQDRILGYLDHLRQEGLAPNLCRIQFATLLRRVAAWYGELSVSRSLSVYPAAWPAAHYRGYQAERESFSLHIVQITVAKALQDESSYMKHCVSSYLPRCAAGQCSIWSLRKVFADGNIIRLLTIELDKDGRIVQVRGKYNATASAEEQAIIRQWADEAGLQVLRF